MTNNNNDDDNITARDMVSRCIPSCIHRSVLSRTDGGLISSFRSCGAKHVTKNFVLETSSVRYTVDKYFNADVYCGITFNI